VKAGQIKEEAKVKAAAAELQDKLDQGKKVRVGDIHGKWKLFSSEHVKFYIQQEDQDIDDTDWESGVGTIEFGKHLTDPEVEESFGSGDMGMKIDIYGGPIDGKGVDLNKPEYAFMDPITVNLCHEDPEEGLKQGSVDVAFLGNGFLQLRITEDLLGGQGYKDVYFADIHNQDRKAVKRDAEAFDEAWRNDKYTGGFHPDNNKRLKAAMEEHGIPDDTQSSGPGK
jgi:hypothetical protein